MSLSDIPFTSALRCIKSTRSFHNKIKLYSNKVFFVNEVLLKHRPPSGLASTESPFYHNFKNICSCTLNWQHEESQLYKKRFLCNFEKKRTNLLPPLTTSIKSKHTRNSVMLPV